jgi:hypothetical protein
MASNKGKLIGGVALVAEGTALALYGIRYLDFMERHGLMDLGKRLLRRTRIRSHKSLAAIGIAEAVVGLVLLDRVRRYRPATA